MMEIRSLVACGRYNGVTAEKQQGTLWGSWNVPIFCLGWMPHRFVNLSQVSKLCTLS